MYKSVAHVVYTNIFKQTHIIQIALNNDWSSTVDPL